MSDDLEPTIDEQPREPSTPEPSPEPAPINGLTLVKSEWHGEHGDEHHWFVIPAGHTQAEYQDELDAFIAQRATITADDITVTIAS